MSVSQESLTDKRAYIGGIRKIARELWHWHRRYPELDKDRTVLDVATSLFRKARNAEAQLK